MSIHFLAFYYSVNSWLWSMKLFNDLQVVQQAKFYSTKDFHLNSFDAIYTKIPCTYVHSEISSRLAYFFMNVRILRLNMGRRQFELKFLGIRGVSLSKWNICYNSNFFLRQIPGVDCYHKIPGSH